MLMDDELLRTVGNRTDDPLEVSNGYRAIISAMRPSKPSDPMQGAGRGVDPGSQRGFLGFYTLHLKAPRLHRSFVLKVLKAGRYSLRLGLIPAGSKVVARHLVCFPRPPGKCPGQNYPGTGTKRRLCVEREE